MGRRIPMVIALAFALSMTACGDPPTRIGQTCQTDAHCGNEGEFSLSCDHSIPGGACTLEGCDPAQTSSCPAGAVCMPEGDESACRLACQQAFDCREVIACRPDPACQEVEGCEEHCDNAMTCAPADPEADPIASSPHGCVFTGI